MILLSVNNYLAEWRKRQMIVFGLAVIIAVIALYLLIHLLELSAFWWSSIVLLIGIYFWIGKKYWPNRDSSIQYLHKQYPEFEYSLRLLDVDENSLNVLGSLQKRGLENLSKSIDVKFSSPRKLILELTMALIFSVILIGFGSQFPLPKAQKSGQTQNISKENQQQIITKDSAYIDDLRLKLFPPPYTKLKSSTVRILENEVPEGTSIEWDFTTHGSVESVAFNFGNDRSQDSKNKQFFKSEIYYYTVRDSSGESVNSPYYSIKIKEDNKPSIEISGIEEYQRLPWKENYDINFNISISDDYGVQDAFVSATVANGQGESVMFREKTFPLKNLGKSKFGFSTSEFNMEPGSELYFYVMAKDNCPYRIQATKTTTYFVILEDTAKYEFVDDAGMQVDLMPEFFRSQRQIIIDSEKLLAEKSKIAEKDFKQRSNELGFDQKMLRLKYGQFLGEEDDSGIAMENKIEIENEIDGPQEVNVLEEYGHNHDHEDEENQLLETNGTMPKDPARPDWVEAMSHNHDDAEENTYFDVSLKSKLKAALTVMWDSELHLRLYDPSKSLPYQYEALKYLEEIKNHARVYVHRIGFDPPVIKESEKRLTGKQDKIISPSDEKQVEFKNELIQIKLAIAFISKKLNSEDLFLEETDKNLLQMAGNELTVFAIQDPSMLPTLTLMRKIIDQNEGVSLNNRKLILNGLLKALPQDQKEVIHKNIRMHRVMKAAFEVL